MAATVSVEGIEIDIVNYDGPIQFQVYTEFINPDEYSIVVRRLDVNAGWTDTISVLVVHEFFQRIIPIGSSNEAVEKRTVVRSPVPLTPATKPTERLESYAELSALAIPDIQRISRRMFNQVFQTDIKALPRNLFAVGLRNGSIYMYNETYECFFMIELTLRHIIRTALYAKFRKTYFIISAHDGYLEHHYLSDRTVPLVVGDTEWKDALYVQVADNIYPVFYSRKWILAQSTHRGTPMCIDMPDRYYFYLNHYNIYRSIHMGQAFHTKIPKIVYASQPRGTKYNFVTRRDICISQREYFYSDRVSKLNIVAPKQIDRKEQIQYKYILDIDGNASTWDATAWKLNSGSVLLKTNGPWRQWFYDDFHPWVHYVPIADDFSDIDAKFEWCEAHPHKCLAMISECKQLFQKIYHYPNIIKYTMTKLFEISGLPLPIPISKGRRLFVFHDPAQRMSALYHAARSLNAKNDLLFFINHRLCDYNAYDIDEFIRKYDALGKQIITGAEKNLWPHSLAPYRSQFDAVCDSNNPFRYLQVDMMLGTVCEFYRIFDERIYDPTTGISDQEYFARAWLTGKYDIGLDLNQSLALMTFQCDRATIARHKLAGVPLIVWNGGRF
jgi:hypothetical protein